MHTPRTTLTVLLLIAGALPGLASAQSLQDQNGALSETLAAASADRTAAGCPPLAFSNLQRRVLTEADRGATELRAYVQRTRLIHMLDLNETSQWVAQVRERNRDCRTVISAAAP